MNTEEAEWEVWYQDMFDRECPRQVEVVGQGLQKGLFELWARHLRETVQSGCKKGFSRFNLWLPHEKKSFEVAGDWEGQARLRKWVYGKEGDRGLLNRISIRHKRYALRGETSEEILMRAKEAVDQSDFEKWLMK